MPTPPYVREASWALVPGRTVHVVMAVLVVSSWLATRALSVETRFSRWQSFLEVIVSYMRRQIGEICQQDPDMFLPFIGTIFLFIALANVLGIVPGYVPPTASLSTTVAMAICVFVAVPLFDAWVLPFGLLGALAVPSCGAEALVPAALGSQIILDLAALGERLPATPIAWVALAAVPLGWSPRWVRRIGSTRMAAMSARRRP